MNMQKGKITYWDDDKGFGFITQKTNEDQVFLHISAFSNRDQRPTINQIVTYALSADKQGRPCAINATLIGSRFLQMPKWKNISRSSITAISFLSFVGILVLIGKIPSLVFAIYLVVSLITFIIYARDKSAAQNDTWRIQETTLHLLSLAGGWPGALVAQQNLRHKSQKQSFRIIFWLTVILNCVAFLLLFTEMYI